MVVGTAPQDRRMIVIGENWRKKTRATTAYAEQTTVAAFLPWRGS